MASQTFHGSYGPTLNGSYGRRSDGLNTRELVPLYPLTQRNVTVTMPTMARECLYSPYTTERSELVLVRYPLKLVLGFPTSRLISDHLASSGHAGIDPVDHRYTNLDSANANCSRKMIEP